MYLFEHDDLIAWRRSLQPGSIFDTLLRWFGYVADAIVVTARMQVVVAVVNAVVTMPVLFLLGLKHIGFKDVGVPTKTLKALTAAIKEIGATSYLEVVSETPEACLNSARVGAELGIDCLLGGTAAIDILNILKGTRTLYYPFPGKPTGHPTKLGGTPKDIEADCRKFLDAGCAGVDLLAYRATDADPLELVKAARRGLGTNRLIVAGSIASRSRIRDIA
jgi:hypothetical protein